MSVIQVPGRDGSLEFRIHGTDEVALKIGGNRDATASEPTYTTERIAKIPLAAVDTAGGVFAFQNPNDTPIIVTGVRVYVSTIATAACSISVGSTATSATTSSVNLIDTLDVHSATGDFSNKKNPGTNGKDSQLVAAGKWITGSVSSGASAGLVGKVILYFITV